MAQRKYYRKIYQNNRGKRIFSILKYLILIMLVFLIGGSLLVIYFTKDLPLPRGFEEKLIVHPTRIYDSSGQVLLFTLHERKQIKVPLAIIPNHLKNAFIATEDANFWEHPGICVRGIARSIWSNIRLGKIRYGASTITQQLARTAFLTRERTFRRKVREISLTFVIEDRYEKEEILEMYLNQISFGANIYGVEAASQAFFRKSVSEISLAESTILAALIKAPTLLSPHGENKDQLLARQNHVLRRMEYVGFISQKQAKEARQESLEFSRLITPIKAPHFTLSIKRELENQFGKEFLRKRGLKVITSLDWELQQLAEQTIKERIEANRAHNAHNAALVAIDPNTGHILALVGSVDWFANSYPKGCISGVNCLFDPKVNVATSLRQPGSAFKPFIFAAIFEESLKNNDEIIIFDEKTNFGIWGGRSFIPQNFDLKFRGPVTLRQILAQSLNMPTVKALRDLVGLGDFSIGIKNSVNISEDLGITTLQPSYFYGPSFALGVSNVNLIDMVSAYGVFATEGLRVPPVKILRIKHAGRVIQENEKTLNRVIKPSTAKFINNILSDKEARAPIFGRRLDLHSNGLDYNVAVKTGTTDNFRDGWTVGYTFGNTFNNTPLAVGVWVGNNDNSPTRSPGLILAAPIWKTFIEGTLF